MAKKFQKKKVYVKGIDEIFAADLVDMQAFSEFKNGVKYLLTVIDVFSRYVWMVPLKTKTGLEVTNALKKIFQYRKGSKLWVDRGREFYNKHVQELIPLYSTENEEKSSVVERRNRTMKEKMFKYFSANSTKKYIDILDRLVEDYNNTRHSSTGFTPKEASKKKNESEVWWNLYGKYSPLKRKKPEFSVGDRVRISKKKGVFEKGYTPRWIEEVFKVSEVHYTEPITYKIMDLNNDEIQGSFYEPELQKTTQEMFRIEKVIRRKGNKSLVKWLGYPESFNSWVDSKDLVKL